MVHTESDRRVEKVKWNGKLGEKIEAMMRLDNALLPDAKRTCRCGAVVDMNDVAELELGTKLGIALKSIDGYLKWLKAWNAIHRKALARKVSLDKLFEKRIRLYARYLNRENEWGSSDVSFSTNAICPKCLTSVGRLTVTLRVVDLPEVLDLTKQQLAELEVSKEILAHASKRMQFNSVEALKAWRDNADAEKAKRVLQEAITQLKELALPYETSKITGTLTSLITDIDKEAHMRKIELVDAVEKIMNERVHPIA